MKDDIKHASNTRMEMLLSNVTTFGSTSDQNSHVTKFMKALYMLHVNSNQFFSYCTFKIF